MRELEHGPSALGKLARRRVPYLRCRVKRPVPRNATLRRELVLCGKPKCSKHHGPYWYAYWEAGGRTHKVYVGKELPPELSARAAASARAPGAAGGEREG